jgi:hypothetical protein
MPLCSATVSVRGLQRADYEWRPGPEGMKGQKVECCTIAERQHVVDDIDVSPAGKDLQGGDIAAKMKEKALDVACWNPTGWINRHEVNAR